MFEHGVVYKRRGFYLLITIPMILMYIAIGIYLWTIRPVFFLIYLGLFIGVMVAQAAVCIHWKCPHVGTICPGVGGFCMPSGYLAKWLFMKRRPKLNADAATTIAFIFFGGIILLPIVFIMKLGCVYLLAYAAVILAYAAGMFLVVCPECGARDVCPGGKIAVSLKKE